MPAPADLAASDRVARRFATRFQHGYARGKLRHDPVFATSAQMLLDDPRPLLDIGCGLALLGLYLRECGWRGAYHGLDSDAAKVAAARRAAAGLAQFQLDAAQAQVLPPFAGHVALIDVLHYLPREQQPLLLREAAARVAPGACLVVRSVLRTPGWRFQLTRAEEWCIHRLGWMPTRVRHYPLREEIESPLRAAGLDVEVQPLWHGTPFNSFAIFARRAGLPA